MHGSVLMNFVDHHRSGVVILSAAKDLMAEQRDPSLRSG